jgi:hypothetical protein
MTEFTRKWPPMMCGKLKFAAGLKGSIIAVCYHCWIRGYGDRFSAHLLRLGRPKSIADSRLRHAQLSGNRTPALARLAHGDSPVTPEDAHGPAVRKVFAGAAVAPLTNLTRLMGPAVFEQASAYPLSDQVPFEFGEGSQDVHHELSQRTVVIGVDALAWYVEADSRGIHCPNALDDMLQGSAEAVEFPAEDDVKLP